MDEKPVYKKMTRKADKGLEGKVIAKHRKQTNQKLNRRLLNISHGDSCHNYTS